MRLPPASKKDFKSKLPKRTPNLKPLPNLKLLLVINSNRIKERPTPTLSKKM